jgi:hypothetical protein
VSDLPRSLFVALKKVSVNNLKEIANLIKRLAMIADVMEMELLSIIRVLQ